MGPSGDHPRVCGEKGSAVRVINGKLGSPPRMRGKAVAITCRAWNPRITPAYAGKSGIDSIYYFENGDHPRVCGEKSGRGSRSWYGPGSPPRMRGKGCCHHLVVLVHGITPAYAGKRNCRFTQWRRGFGSPPRMRGKADPNDSKVSAPRITPAYAGKSVSILPTVFLFQDHPRVCWEKPLKAL